MARERAPRPDAERGRPAAGEIDPERLVPARGNRRHLIVGAFVLAGILATLGALFALTDPGTFRGRYHVYTVVDNAGGIRKGDPVQLRGVNIGRVQDFRILSNGVVVQMELENQYRPPADSRVALTSSGLLGGMTATIVAGDARNALEDGDTIPGTAAAGAFDMAEQVGERADQVLQRAQMLLTPELAANVHTSAEELRRLLAETSAMVAEDRASIRALTASLNRTAAGLEAAEPGERLSALAVKLDSASARLGEAVRNFNTASASLAAVVGRIERGEGTLGKLSRDEALYANLTAAADNLNRLAVDIRANPRKYLNLEIF